MILDIFEIPLNKKHWSIASKRVLEIPIYKGSHRGLNANQVGSLGEVVFEEFLELNKIDTQPIFPVTSARFFRKFSGKEIDRTFNFTWMKDLPEGNEIVAGTWFKENENGISISSEISERYELELNDKIVIDIAGKRVDSYIQSIREVNWENFSPNFFAIGFPEDFEDVSSTYITSSSTSTSIKIVEKQ